MSFQPLIAERRFGFGLSPDVAPPRSVSDMLAGVAGPDHMQERFPVADYGYLQRQMVLIRRFNDHVRANPDTPEAEASRKKSRDLNREALLEQTRWFAQLQLRCIRTPHAFRERLIAFWADHMTAVGKFGLLRLAGSAYVEDAVRPNVNRTFADLLIACVTHPLMLTYLDQSSSVGPQSGIGKRQGKNRGLNENLARELLELHTLGVDGPYGQADVRELAELLTGLGTTRNFDFKFRFGMVEPGAETVLGKTYGGPPTLEPIKAVLRDLAVHPATADHIARKLAVHFVADIPPDDLVAHLRAAYLRSGGDLMTLYAALLDHPAAWNAPATNIRPPLEFMTSALRALAAPPEAFADLRERDTREMFFRPLTLMGQTWQRPEGPDGWSEADAAWVSPQGMAARLEWAVHVPTRLLDALPDPREFVRQALGDAAPAEVVFAAGAAERRAEAIGLVLSSPAFQRR